MKFISKMHEKSLQRAITKIGISIQFSNNGQVYFGEMVNGYQ